MRVERLEHLVLTARDIAATCDFYSRVCGMAVVTFSGDRKALQFGNQKINLHEVGHEFEPKAEHPVPGSTDLCFITTAPIAQVVAHLKAHAVPVVEGPVQRSGALGEMESVYVRDPDGNLVEIARYSDLSGVDDPAR
jgi:catechol 2,3-dioxygenase-like lactoylglutathione lyase family enzyme